MKHTLGYEKRYKLYRPDGKGIRGISYNHLGVITMIDISGRCIAKVASRATPKPKKSLNYVHIILEISRKSSMMEQHAKDNL